MKKAIRILIPVFLALIILLCTVWYLFVYDREFTRDILLSCARHSESQGKHDAAAWFYDLAYAQAKDNDAVAIELAEQYKSIGNYTKAEDTLSDAIEDGGGVELYIALCKTYVEQDKLSDAVKMLNSVTNTEIKAELDALRPAAPVASPEPGIYKQYISVEITAESGKLYVTSDGTYPSTVNDAYSGAVTLADGENRIYTLVVADNGLVSPLTIFGYTVGGVVEEVKFADPAVEAAIRAALNVKEDAVLFTNDVWAIETFTMPAEAETYADIRYLPKLKSLTIENGVPAELKNLSSLSELTSLVIRGTSVSQDDLSLIAALPMLQDLTLSDCNLSSISALEKSVKLTKLDLSDNTIRNISALRGLENLQELDLKHNVVTDLSPLNTLKELAVLDVSYNALTSLSSLSANTALTTLAADNNGITELGQLGSLTSLASLSLSGNSIEDVSALAACTALTNLNIANNDFTDITALSALTKLMYFDFSYNQVVDLPVWPKDCALVAIDGSHNLIETIDPLVGLEYLNNVFMDYNEELESISALVDCPMLIQVDVYGTSVTDVKALTHTEDGMERGIIVNYDPTK